jgi:protein kinase-like protein/WD40 domain-containing protein
MGMAMQPNSASQSNLLALPDGTELVGDFRIKRVLGAGGFGITYLAEEMALARLVTIKEYFPADYAARRATKEAVPRSQDCAGDYKWGLERFIEEAQTLARFVHPNIVRVYRYFRANNTAYMVLQFEEGGSFKAWLRNLKRAPRQPELDQLLKPLLEALEVVHGGNYLHRDIAPDNIMVRKDGSPVLIDFGSARGEIASHTKTVSALVKPGYSPYEQYATTTRQQGPWTDIYALGATLYHAVSGKRPPDAPSRMVSDEYVPAADVALSSYRPQFLAAIDKALRLDVNERPQSVAVWRDVLLAEEPKRRRGLGLGRALERLRTGDAAAPAPQPAAEAASAAAAVPSPAPPATPAAAQPSPVNEPVPQPKAEISQRGKVLDFFDAWKKKRLAAPAKKTASNAKVAPAPGPKEKARKPKRDIASAESAAKVAKAPVTDVLSVPRPVPAVLARRAPKPQRVRGWRIPSRRWRSLAYKLLIGIGIASLAVAYQDKIPRVEGRGAGVVTSQATDLAPLARIAGHRGAVTGLATADQGRWIVSAGVDGTLKVWNSGSGALVRAIELDEGPATAIAVDERRALTGHKGGTIVLWDLERAERLASFQHQQAPISALAFIGDDDHFAAASHTNAVAVFAIRDPAAPVAIFEGQDAGPTIAGARWVSLLAAAGGQDRGIRLWRTDTKSLTRTWRRHGEAVSALDITAGGRRIASGSVSGAVRLWSTSSSRPQRSFQAHQGRVTSVVFGPEDRLLASAGEDGQVKLWDLRSGRPPKVFRGHAGAVHAVAFSNDGRRILSAGQDGVIRIWNGIATAARD